LNEIEAFTWFMPGNPPFTSSPTEGCWDWPASTNSHGYGQFSMIINHKPTMVGAHQVAYRKFVGIIPDGLIILHSCDRPPCCQPAHLRTGTISDNSQDAWERGQMMTGERCPWAKLTENNIRFIRQCSLTPLELSEMFEVDRSTISLIRSKKIWKHVS
jgi:hypothetical protein